MTRPAPCSVGSVSTRSPACKPAIRFASLSGEANNGYWLIGSFVRTLSSKARGGLARWSGLTPPQGRASYPPRCNKCHICQRTHRSAISFTGVRTFLADSSASSLLKADAKSMSKCPAIMAAAAFASGLGCPPSVRMRAPLRTRRGSSAMP